MRTLRHTVAALATLAIALAVILVSAEGASHPAVGASLASAIRTSSTRVAVLADGSGYWLAASNGGVFTFGNATFYGSMAGQTLKSPVIGIVATADGHGYWLVAKDGGVFAFGDAAFAGSASGKTITPIVGMAAKGAGAAVPGPAGPRGATGLRGPAGRIGPAGAPAVTHYAYVYNLTPRAVALEADILFDSNGALSGFTHAPGTASITVTNTGVYRVDLSESGTEVSQFALTVNGVPVAQTLYGSGAGTQQNDGRAILTLSAGDVLTVRNHTSASAVSLPTVVGGSQANVTASVLIEQLG